MTKQEQIKAIVEQYIDEQTTGAYTMMKRAGFDSGEDMEIFYKIYDEMMEEKQNVEK